jgi:hypothetical protein
MQCTSTPAAMALLKILENAIEDQPNRPPNDVFNVAAKYVLYARYRLTSGKVPSDMGTNERLFSGAMANAINSVLRDGYCVMHQACLGTGATHSDLSATCIDTEWWPATLMVGEAKWNSSNLREETRGQMFNELLRHRSIDKPGEREVHNGPILLLAFDKNMVEIDLAFPSTKGGKVETDGVVEVAECTGKGKEIFWTVQILRISIRQQNLAIVLRFISDALEKLYSWSGQGRVQYKMPRPDVVEIAAVAQDAGKNVTIFKYAGENVTIIEEASGSRFVYKEYCYHLRQACNVMEPLFPINEEDKRQPPPKELLEVLGSPYSEEWSVRKGSFRTSILCYPFIEGNSYTPSVAGWLKILRQIQAMHKIDFIHGDLLPRNVLFDAEGNGYVIDFYLSRKVGGTYVSGYNHDDFKAFRHNGAKELQSMMKDHDVRSLREMSKFFST